MSRVYKTVQQGESVMDIPMDTVAQQLGRQLLKILELQTQVEQQRQTITALAAELEQRKTVEAP